MTSQQPSKPRIAVRDVAVSDGDLLVDMVLEAVNWDGEHHTRRGVLKTPQLARYAVGWGRPGDLGLVAVDLDGPRGLHVPVGAAWIRHFRSTEPGYGFLEPGVPELSLAIVPGRRRMGIGRALLVAILDRARESGIRRVSLSVGRANPAKELYESAGFVAVEDAESSTESAVTMVLDLYPDPGDGAGSYSLGSGAARSTSS